MPESSATQRIAEYRAALLEREIYPLAFVWKSDFWSTLKNILEDALRRRRPEGFLDDTKDFMLNRLDDALEPIARHFLGKMQWDEMKENATCATTSAEGGARFTAGLLREVVGGDNPFELHLLGHSAGAIFLAPLVQLLTTEGEISSGPMAGAQGFGLPIKTCTLWAPACTLELFDETYLPAIENGKIADFALFTLKDAVEQDDNCGNIYHKSLLYLVSNAFEEKPHIPLLQPGEPLLGMETFVDKHERLTRLFADGQATWVKAPNTQEKGSATASTARHHGGFDDDRPTVLALLARLLGGALAADTGVRIHRSESYLRDRRIRLDEVTTVS